MTEIINPIYGRPEAKMYVYAFKDTHVLRLYLLHHPVYKAIADRVVSAMGRGAVALPWRGYREVMGMAGVQAQEAYGVDVISEVEYNAMIVQSSPIRKVLGEGYV